MPSIVPPQAEMIEVNSCRGLFSEQKQLYDLLSILALIIAMKPLRFDGPSLVEMKLIFITFVKESIEEILEVPHNVLVNSKPVRLTLGSRISTRSPREQLGVNGMLKVLKLSFK